MLKPYKDRVVSATFGTQNTSGIKESLSLTSLIFSCLTSGNGWTNK